MGRPLDERWLKRQVLDRDQPTVHCWVFETVRFVLLL